MLDAEKVLFVLPARLGDTLFCTPAIQLLHKHRPQTQIGILAPTPLAAGVFANNPAVKEIITAPDQNTLQTITQTYSLAICLHSDALTQDYIHKLGIQSLTVPFANDDEKQVEKELEFMRKHLNCELEENDKPYRLHPQPENFAKISSLLKSNNIDPGKNILIGCHLGCHGLAKRGWRFWKKHSHEKTWPLRNYIQLGRKLSAAYPNLKILITGTKNEKQLASKILKKVSAGVDIVDQTSILDLAALMPSLRVFIAADTGALHIALATSVNLVGMYGWDISPRNYPYPSQKNRIVIHGDSVHNIGVKEIYQAVLKLID